MDGVQTFLASPSDSSMGSRKCARDVRCVDCRQGPVGREAGEVKGTRLLLFFVACSALDLSPKGPMLFHPLCPYLCLLNRGDPFRRDGDGELPFFLKNVSNHSPACPGLKSLQDRLTSQLPPSAGEPSENPRAWECKVTCQRSRRGRVTKLGLEPGSLAACHPCGGAVRVRCWRLLEAQTPFYKQDPRPWPVLDLGPVHIRPQC